MLKGLKDTEKTFLKSSASPVRALVFAVTLIPDAVPSATEVTVVFNSAPTVPERITPLCV